MDLFEGLPEPVAKAWERSLTGGRAAMSRRRLLRAASLAAAGSTLAACGIPPAVGDKSGNAPEDAPDHSREERRSSTSPTGPSTSMSTRRTRRSVPLSTASSARAGSR